MDHNRYMYNTISAMKKDIHVDLPKGMLMHFPVDPVMPVVSSVRVGSHRNECLLLMYSVGVQTVMHVYLTRTTNILWIVKDMLVIVMPLSSWNQPGLPPSWGNSTKQILSLKLLFNGRKQDGKRNTIVGRCVTSETLWSQWERCPLSQMGKWQRRSDNWPGCSSQKIVFAVHHSHMSASHHGVHCMCSPISLSLPRTYISSSQIGCLSFWCTPSTS